MNDLYANVLVVGGGPAGSATAALLARLGHDVLLLERAIFPREKACAEYFSPGVVDVLQRLGVLEKVRSAGAALPLGMRVSTERRAFLVEYPNGHMLRTALGLSRPVFDSILLAHARANGARVREGVRAAGAITEGGRVVGVWAQGQAGEERLHARVVVGADGLHSAVARSLGLARPAPWPRRLGLIARYEGVTGIEQYGEMHVGRGLYCGIAPIGGGLVNVGLVTALGAKRGDESVERFFERCLEGLPAAKKALAGARRVTPIRGIGPLARRVRRAVGPGYLLVGDAAGFLDPFTGEGVFRALRGGELAAEAIDRMLRPSTEGVRQGSHTPHGYEEARRREFADKERVCLVIQGLLSAQRAFEYAAGRLSQRRAAAQVLSGVLGDYRPARSALRPSYIWDLLRP